MNLKNKPLLMQHLSYNLNKGNILNSNNKTLFSNALSGEFNSDMFSYLLNMGKLRLNYIKSINT